VTIWQESRRLLADGEALNADFLGQERLWRSWAGVCTFTRFDVGIGAEREGDGQRIAAVGALADWLDRALLSSPVIC
jgi:hypothetical protein